MDSRKELDFCLELKPTLHGPLLRPLDGYQLSIRKLSSVHLFYQMQIWLWSYSKDGKQKKKMLYFQFINWWACLITVPYPPAPIALISRKSFVLNLRSSSVKHLALLIFGASPISCPIDPHDAEKVHKKIRKEVKQHEMMTISNETMRCNKLPKGSLIETSFWARFFCRTA